MNKKLIKVEATRIKPYENNPRINDGAVEAVRKSIEQCGYVSPIIVDEDFVILAGHTRYKAMQGKQQLEVMQVTGLTEDQKKKYRILDNKTSEFAEWDLEALEKELMGLDFDGFDFGFGDLEKQMDSMDQGMSGAGTPQHREYEYESYTHTQGVTNGESPAGPPAGPTAETAQYFSDDYIPDQYDKNLEAQYGEAHTLSTVVTIICQNDEEVEFIKSMLLECDEIKKLYKAKTLMERFGDGD